MFICFMLTARNKTSIFDHVHTDNTVVLLSHTLILWHPLGPDCRLRHGTHLGLALASSLGGLVLKVFVVKVVQVVVVVQDSLQ